MKIKKRKMRHAVKIYRASIRVSLNGDKNSALRQALKKEAFEPNGFINDPGAHGTGTWINVNCTVEEMRDCISTLWAVVSQHKGTAKLDHIWSSFELIDLRTLIAGAKKPDRMSEELSEFLIEQGIKKGPKK